jgi:hypothetical protein
VLLDLRRSAMSETQKSDAEAGSALPRQEGDRQGRSCRRYFHSSANCHRTWQLMAVREAS